MDFDLHGVVGIRVLDASPQDIATAQRQLGPLQRPLDREPDITVRFVERATSAPLTYVGLGEGGFNDDGFFVLRGKGDDRAKALVPFARIGQQPEILCERGMPSIPHLLAIINLTALAKGVLPLHASAFTADSTGVLVTGWAKGGKTESLLACMSRGAQYVGDEWVYLTDDGQMLGLPEPIRLWSWHLHQVPHLLQARSRRDRLRLAMWHRAARLAAQASDARLPGRGLIRKGAPIIGRQAYLQVPPVDLFGRDAVVLRGRLDAVVLVETREEPGIAIEPVGPSEVSGRMAASLVWERSQFMDHYLQFRYSRPGGTSALVEGAEALEGRLLAEMLDGRPSAKVLHPYPCDIDDLGQHVMSAALSAVAAGKAGVR